MSEAIPCVAFPLAREAGPFRRRLRAVRVDPAVPRPARGWTGTAPGGRPVRVILTGVGLDRTAESLQAWVDKGGRASHMILAGFAGALTPDLEIGSIVRPAAVVDHASGREWPVDGIEASGRLVTHPTMVGRPSDKAALGQKWQAVAVDMEAAGFARFCAGQAIPFRCIRSISDRLQDQLSPDLLLLVEGHSRRQVTVARFARSVLARPSYLFELGRLARDTGTAANRLADELIGLLNRQADPSPSYSDTVDCSGT